MVEALTMSCLAIRPGTSASGTHWIAVDSKSIGGSADLDRVLADEDVVRGVHDARGRLSEQQRLELPGPPAGFLLDLAGRSLRPGSPRRRSCPWVSPSPTAR